MHLTPQSPWQQAAVCKDAAPGAAIWIPEQHTCACPAHKTFIPPPTDEIPIKQPTYGQSGECVCPGTMTGTSPFCFVKLKRPKLSFASEHYSILFYWTERQQAAGPLLGPDSGGSVTEGKKTIFSQFGEDHSQTQCYWALVCFLSYKMGTSSLCLVCEWIMPDQLMVKLSC